MKGTGKFILGFAMVAAVLIVYVHLNIQLFSLSYSINQKSKAVVQQDEYYRLLKYEVNQLKAPHRLNEQMEALNLELDLPEEIKVIRIPAQSVAVNPRMDDQLVNPITGGLMDFFGRWVRVAQAKTDA